MILKLFSDGGSRGNPGPGASAVLIFTEDDKLCDFSGSYFPVTTNNNAEYQALMIGIKLVVKKYSGQLNAIELECYLDSELVVKQMRGEYKVTDANIKNLKAQIDPYLTGFQDVRFIHIPREQNKLADRLVNLILDTKLSNDL